MSAPPLDDDAIYLDHAATTPLDPDVLAAMLPFFERHFGNPSSIYRAGQEARASLDEARDLAASCLGCQPAEIVFTSGATESDNLALKGVAWAHRFADDGGAPPHLVTTNIEHHAVLHAAGALERQGFAVTYLPCDRDGLVSVEDVEAALRPETCLVSVMYANNEVGSIQPITEIGNLLKPLSIPFHTDAVQAAGALPIRVEALNVDLLSLSAHKFYGPKGIGLLYVRRGTPISWQQNGGGQEGGRRGGTEAVPMIVGLAVALEKAERLREAYAVRCSSLRDRLWQGIAATIPEARLNGPPLDGRRLPNNLNLMLPGIQGETVLLGLDMEGIAASAGSACTTGNSEPSHVLRALGLDEEESRASLRFTVGRDNTHEQMEETVDALADVANRVRALAGAA